MATSAMQATASALAARLRDLDALLGEIDDETYRWQPPGGISGTIGAHVRHCLDHVDAVLAWRPGVPLSYDQRRRATSIEQDRAAGRQRLLEVADLLEHWDGQAAALVLSLQITRDGAPVHAPTSLARELGFALQHTIHHQAVLAVLLASRHVHVPAGFGLAPATPWPVT